MTVEWYDLGQRLHASRTGEPAPRLLHAPVPRPDQPVAVRARTRGESTTVTAAASGAAPSTARDDGALDLLAGLGVRLTAPRWATLVTDDPTTLSALARLARRSRHDGPHADTAAHLSWWAERADFPGTSAVVDLLDACRTRWATGTAPEAETDPATWRRWLGVRDDGCAGMLAVLDALTGAPPLPLLSHLTDDDAWWWHRAQEEHADGRDWRRPDSTSRAATGLRARCDTADLYAAALLSDPLHRLRAVHTGHVVTGRVDPVPGTTSRVTVTCDRLDARLRTGNAVTGWTGRPADTTPSRFGGTVAATAVHAGQLVLTLSGVTTTGRPDAAARVTVLAAPPDPYAMRRGRSRYSRLYRTGGSWLTTGRTPTPARRDVPLDVLVAGAEPG